MSAISEFAVRQNAHNDKIEAALAGVQADVNALNELIEEFQGTPGKIAAEDQALLDQLEARGAAMAEKMTALDEMTPPKVPGGTAEAGAAVAAVTPPNPNVLPPNPDQTSSQLRGSGAPVVPPQDPNRAPNPPTNQPTEPVPSKSTVGPVGPRV